jgi:hypothetical protein
VLLITKTLLWFPTESNLEAKRTATGKLHLRTRANLALLFFQSIPEPAHAFNHIAGVAKFFAQPSDMRVHCACANDAFVTPDIVEQTVTFLDPTTALYERAGKDVKNGCVQSGMGQFIDRSRKLRLRVG